MPRTTDAPTSSARRRLLDAATALFYAEGIHTVGVDRIIDEAGVTRATMYKQFGGKEQLVLAYLEAEDGQLREVFAAASGGSAGDDALAPERASALLDAVVAGIADDIRSRHTRGCPFINAAAEYPHPGPVRELITAHRDWFRETLRQVAAAAGVADAEALADALVLLRDAALVGGYLDGRDRVAESFTRTAHDLIALHRRA